jgi:PKD repeat protein
MKKTLLYITSISVMMGSWLFGQHHHYHQENEEIEVCSQHSETEKFLETLTPQEREEWHEARANLEAFTQQYIQDNPDAGVPTGSRSIQYTIPIVFHILHAGGPENISNEQIENCVEIMNRDFQLLNADANNVNPVFEGIVADAQIEFKLAKRDPSGNCTNGITRTFTQETFNGSANRVTIVANEHGNWPGNRYLNVFVAADIGGAAGYTMYPGWTGMSNGIHILHNYTGGIGTASPFTSRTMTHEAGHWLNLPHLWGDSNNPGITSNCYDDDGVADTPNTMGWTSCNVNGITCDGINKPVGTIDNVENYMEYSYCSKMYTQGQVARMHAALESPTGGRSTVVSAGNLTFTGVNEPDIMCKADFDASSRVICTGQTVDFTDFSFHSPSGWNWTFQGGTPATSTQQNPTVTYNTAGTYTVTLEATDGSTSATENRTAYITVLPEGATLPFMEGFESYSNLNNSPWMVNNPGNNAAFQIDNTVAHTGDQCVKLANFGQSAGNIDELISQPINLSSITDDMTLSFRYAYRKRSNSNEEWLRIFVSNDCGQNFSLRRNIRGNQLSNIVETSSWEPQSQDDWTTAHVTNITSQFWVDNFRVNFQFESDGGNNFFLDDINIYSGPPSELSVSDEMAELTALNIFPNPASSEVNIKYNVTNSERTEIEIVDVLGKTVSFNAVQSQMGENLVMISTSELGAGVYMVRVKSNGVQQTKRLVIK